MELLRIIIEIKTVIYMAVCMLSIALIDTSPLLFGIIMFFAFIACIFNMFVLEYVIEE